MVDNPWLTGAALTILHHHERFDGRGYPDQLLGSSIPRNARIFAVVDVFDALTSLRPYKQPWPFDKAILQIERDIGNHFDNEIAAIFISIAAPLYQELNQASKADLNCRLVQILTKYFKMA